MSGSADKSAVWVPPAASVSRPLLFNGRVNLEVCLEKSSFIEGEPIVVNVTIDNHSNKSITRMKVRQFIRVNLNYLIQQLTENLFIEI